jgi:hypothetical protein
MAELYGSCDMTETTGGHYLDVGDGPKPISALSGNAFEGAAQTAYRAYLDHRPGCPQCRQSTFICDTAGDLWQAYKDARRQ